jgi:hypothetical protein
MEIGWHSLAAPFRRSPNPYLATIGYVAFGAIAGALSVLAFPALMIASPAGRIVNVVLTPVVAGAAMAAIGSWRRRRDQPTILLDRFAYGYLFALVMALVRLRYGQ